MVNFVNQIIVAVLILTISLSLVQAETFGYNNPNLPQLVEDLFDGNPSSFYMPNNKSVFGNFSFNGGFMNDGCSIIDGGIYCQEGFFVNISALNVTKQNLTIISDLVLDGFTQGSILFIGSSGQIAQDNVRLFWDDANNRLGIGTSSPDWKLDIQEQTGGTLLRLKQSGANQVYMSLDRPSSAVDGFIIFETATVNQFYLGMDGGNADKFTLTPDHLLGSGGLWMDNLGNLGIGTSSPDANLQIAAGSDVIFELESTTTTLGTGNNIGKINWRSNDASAGVGGVVGQINLNAEADFTGGQAKTYMTFNTNTGNAGSLAEAMRIDSSGNVGIGTSSPDVLLHVNGTSSNTIARIENRDSTAYNSSNMLGGGRTFRIDNSHASAGWVSMEFLTRTGTLSSIGAVDDGSSAGHLVFGTGTTVTERMRIDSSGKVGIGTVSPAVPLEVVGDFVIRETDDGNDALKVDATGTYANLGLLRGGVEVIKISAQSATDSFFNNGGNVGIGTVSPDFKLQVDGNIVSETTGTDSLGTQAIRWLKGWFNGLDVDGDLNQTNGNATINMVYGEMWIHKDSGSNATIIDSANVWVNVSGFEDGEQNDQTLNGFSYVGTDTGTLIAQVPGKYKVSYSISFGNAGNNQEYQLAIAKNTERVNQTDVHRKIGSAGDVGNAGTSGFVDLVIGDFINLQVINRDGTGNLLTHAINVNLIRIGN